MQGVPQIGPGPQPINPTVTAPTVVPLALGEVVRGEVLNILPDAVSMRVKKEILLAKADIPLQKGASYLFRVESLSANEVQLKVLQRLTGETEATGNLLLSTLNSLKGAYLTHDQLIALRKVFEKIPESVRKRIPNLSVLEPFFKEIGSLTDGSFKEAIDSTGNFFESKLRALALKLMEKESLLEGTISKKEMDQIIQGDLKGTLLKLKQALQESDIIDLLKENNVRTGELAAAVDKLLSHIELQQLESKLNTAFQTFLPFVWKELKDGKMTFKESYHVQEGTAEYACVIHLDLQEVGKLITHIRMFSDMLHLRFVTENGRFKNLIEEGRPLLEKQLSEIGLVCSSLMITQEKKIDFEKSTLESELDIKI